LSLLLFSCTLDSYRPTMLFDVGASPVDAVAVRSGGTLSTLSCFIVAIESSTPPFSRSVMMPSHSQSCLGLDQFVADKTYSYAEIISGATIALELRRAVDVRIFGVKPASGACPATAAQALALSPRPQLFEVGRSGTVDLTSTSKVRVAASYNELTTPNQLAQCLKLEVFSGVARVGGPFPTLTVAEGGIPPKNPSGAVMPLLLSDYVNQTLLLDRGLSTLEYQRLDFVHPVYALGDLDGMTKVKLTLSNVFGGTAGPNVIPSCYSVQFSPLRNYVQGFFFTSNGGSWTNPASQGEVDGGISFSLTPSNIRDLITPAVGQDYPQGLLVSIASQGLSTGTACSGLLFTAPLTMTLE